MIGSLIFITIGLLITLYAFYEYYRSKKTTNWISTKGEILKSQLIRNLSDIETGETYECRVEYKYKVKSTGKFLIGNRILPFTSIGNYSDNLKIYEKLKPETKITVFYNPKKIRQSCLINDKNFLYKIILTLGILCLLFGLIMSYFSKNEKGIYELNKIEVIE